MTHLSSKEKEALDIFKKMLLKEFPDQIEEIKLFGSKATGRSNKFSDVDVIVVLSDDDWRKRRPVHRAAHEVFLKTNIDLSPVIFSRKHARDMRSIKSPFFANVDREGIAL